MSWRWTSNTALTAVLCEWMLVAAFASESKDDLFKPNYADVMLTPYGGTNVAPRLVASRSRFPLRVIVINDGAFSARYFDAVKQACSAWTEATKNVSQGGVTLTCENGLDPLGADVVIRFGTLSQTNGYEGLTQEFGQWALIRLAVFDASGVPVSLAKLKRVAMHEFGHALGIWGHSPNPKDIMSLDEHASSITDADVNTLLLAYSQDGSKVSPCATKRR